jgi:hypothetical protein
LLQLLGLQSAVADIKAELHQLRSDKVELVERLHTSYQQCSALQQELAREREARQVAQRQLVLQQEALAMAEAAAQGRVLLPAGATGQGRQYQQQQQQYQQQQQQGHDDWQSI